MDERDYHQRSDSTWVNTRFYVRENFDNMKLKNPPLDNEPKLVYRDRMLVLLGKSWRRLSYDEQLVYHGRKALDDAQRLLTSDPLEVFLNSAEVQAKSIYGSKPWGTADAEFPIAEDMFEAVASRFASTSQFMNSSVEKWKDATSSIVYGDGSVPLGLPLHEACPMGKLIRHTPYLSP